MERVSDYMIEPFYCTQDTRVSEIRHLLKKYNYDEILVVDDAENEHPIGLISLSDINDEKLVELDTPFDTSAIELMRKIEIVIEENSSLNECLSAMSDYKVNNAPVVNLDGKLKGMISKNYLQQQFLQ